MMDIDLNNGILIKKVLKMIWNTTYQFTQKNWAKEMGSDEVWILTNKSNTAAMALYSSSGGTIDNSDEQMFHLRFEL